MIKQHESRVSGAFLLSAAQALVLGLGYVTHLLIGRLLGPGQYGIYGVVLSVQTIIGLFLTLGVPSAVSRFVAQDEVHAHGILSRALRIQTGFGLLLAILTVLIAPVIAFLLNDTSLTPYIAFVATIVLFQSFYPVYIQFLSGKHQFTRQAALTSLYALSKLVAAVILLLLFGVYGALGGFAVGGAISAIVGWYWTRSNDHVVHRLGLRQFLSFAGTYVLILVGLQLLMSIDLFMVKAILKDNIQAGYYNAAVTLSRIPYFLLQGLMFVLLPSVSALTKPGASRHDAGKFIEEALRYLIAIIVPGIALASATSKDLVSLFFSSEYQSAAPALTILMIGLGCLSFYLLVANIVAGAGKAKVGLGVTILLLIISSIMGPILIPRLGLIGAALQTTIASAVGLVLLGGYTFYAFRIPFPYRSTVHIIIASTAAVLPTYIWNVSPLFLPVQYIVLCLLYLLVMYVLGEITIRDRERVASLHPKLAWLKK